MWQHGHPHALLPISLSPTPDSSPRQSLDLEMGPSQCRPVAECQGAGVSQERRDCRIFPTGDMHPTAVQTFRPRAPQLSTARLLAPETHQQKGNAAHRALPLPPARRWPSQALCCSLCAGWGQLSALHRPHRLRPPGDTFRCAQQGWVKRVTENYREVEEGVPCRGRGSARQLLGESHIPRWPGWVKKPQKPAHELPPVDARARAHGPPQVEEDWRNLQSRAAGDSACPGPAREAPAGVARVPRGLQSAGGFLRAEGGCHRHQGGHAEAGQQEKQGFRSTDPPGSTAPRPAQQGMPGARV